jgi:hypothetical protein
VNDLRITYVKQPAATAQGELDTLARIYAFVLETKKATELGPGPDDRDTDRLARQERRPA